MNRFMILFLWLICVSLVFGQFARVTLGDGVHFYLAEAFMAAYIASYLWIHRVKVCRSAVHVRHHLLFVLVGYLSLLWIGTAFFATLDENIRSFLYLIRLFALFSFSAVLWRQERIHDSFIPRTLSFSIPVVCILQYIFIPDLRFMASSGWDPHMYRAVGTILDPPIVGGVLLLIFFAQLREGGSRFAGILAYVAIVLLYSRSTYLALLLVTPVSIIWGNLNTRNGNSLKTFAMAFGFVMCTFLLILAAPRTIPSYEQLESAKIARISTVSSRTTEIMKGLEAWRKSPVFGIGYGRVTQYKSETTRSKEVDLSSNHASSAFHSFWVTWLAMTGILGTILLVGVFYEVLRTNFTLIFPFAAVSIIGVFDNVVFHPLVVGIFCLLFLTKAKKLTTVSAHLPSQ